MDISIIPDLKKFEKEQEMLLETRKKELEIELIKKKKALLEKNEMETYEITSNKHNIVKEAEEKARKDASEKISSFETLTKKLYDDSSDKLQDSIKKIFSDFLDQNV